MSRYFVKHYLHNVDRPGMEIMIAHTVITDMTEDEVRLSFWKDVEYPDLDEVARPLRVDGWIFEPAALDVVKEEDEDSMDRYHWEHKGNG